MIEHINTEPVTEVTEAQRDRAREKRAELETERDAMAPTDSRRAALTLEIANKWIPIERAERPAPEEPARLAPTAELALRDEQAKLYQRWRALPMGHPDERAIRARYEEISQTLHGNEPGTSTTSTPSFTEKDLAHTLDTYGVMAEAQARYLALGTAVGATPLELTQLVTSIRAWDGQTPPPAEELDLDRLWRGEADANIRAIERVRRQVPAADWRREIVPFLGVERVVQLLAAVGKRLG